MNIKDRVSIELKDGVADVRLIRADKMNALDHAMFEGIIDAGAGARDDEGPARGRAVGRGQGLLRRPRHGKLCRQKDRRQRAVPGARDLTARTHGIANRPQQCAWVWRNLPVPVIAAVHGVAFGGGFQIALGADMRYVTADTRFSVMEIKWGLVPDIAGTQLMRHLAREDIVRELTYTGRIFNGNEAQQYGFVTRVVADPRAAALETAQEIANKSPDAIRAAKRIAERRRRGRRRSRPDGGIGRAEEADRLAQPGRGGDVEPAEARRQLQGLVPSPGSVRSSRLEGWATDTVLVPILRDAARRAAPQDEAVARSRRSK